MKHLQYLNKYLFKYRGQLSLGVLFIILTNLFAVYSPKIVRIAINSAEQIISHSGNSLFSAPDLVLLFDVFGLPVPSSLVYAGGMDKVNLIGTIALLMGACYLMTFIIKGVFLFLTRQMVIVVSRKIEFDLKNEIFAQYQRLDTAFYKRNNTGDLMNRISEDVSKVRMYLGPAIMYTINLTFLFIMSLSAMFVVNAELTIYVLIPLPIMSVLIYYVSNRINQKSEQVQRQQSVLSTLSQEAFSGVRVLKSYNRTEEEVNRFEDACGEYKNKTLSLVKTEALFHPIILLLIGLSTIITIYVGGLKAMDGTIQVGNIAEFVIYVNMLTWPFASVGWVTSLVQRAAASQERINDFLKVEPTIKSGTNYPNTFNGELVFKDVSLTYPMTNITALKNLNFTIPSGKTVAFIGKTGSGKSSIVALINRLYDPSSGSISVDGQNLNTLDLDRYRKSIGFVPQDVFLFSDTVKNNILFGIEGDASQEEVEWAAKFAHVHHNITDLPKKYETILGERGVNLSGGQKQRISIARAVMRKPKIAIFDDCLSAVDTETEEIILGNLSTFITDRTAILVSHRISGVKNADHIFFLENGEITEQGTHSQLLEKEGTYRALFIQQQLESEEKEGQD
ncbi:MAG: ATP-binding cassette subfamily B multidrug efflux pump [Sphingobacteriales bacterium]|jgi:ATP-binding cassette subfamily B multidrug efflux pump